MAEAAGQVIELPSYTVHERLGAGGFGEVFRARHDKIGRDVAIKVLHAKYSDDETAVARFVAEARAVNLIKHPSIVDVFDFGTLADGRSYFVMELLRGQSLRARLAKQAPVAIADALPLLRSIAEAIDAAHAAGIAHRDLKPDNVFLTDDGAIKLIDFGLAKLVQTSDAPLTSTGAMIGTPSYMSPEQCRGDKVGIKSDAYSFGVLAFELLVGSVPFTGDPLEVALHHVNDDPPSPSSRNPALGQREDRVLLALLAKDPARRPLPLAAVVAQLAPEAPLPPRPPPSVAKRRRRTQLFGGAAVTLAVSGGAWLALTRHAGAPVEDSACPPASVRLRGVWDSATRGRAEKHMAATGRIDAPAVWRVLSTELDEHTKAWAEAWESACHSEDRVNAPLVYAQRLTCLDNLLLETRTVTDVLQQPDLSSYMDTTGGTLLSPIDDCKSAQFLRAQPPGVPADRRDEVMALEAKVQERAAAAWAVIGGGQRTEAEPRIEEVRIATEGVKQARSPWAVYDMINYSSMLGAEAKLRLDHPELAPSAQKAARDTVEYAKQVHDDAALPYAWLNVVDLENGLGHADAAAAALDSAEAALDRAGHPTLASYTAALARARSNANKHAYDAALADYDRAEAYARAVPGLGPVIDEERAALLGRIGRRADAVATSQRGVAWLDQRWGPDNVNSTHFRQSLSWILLAASRPQEARDTTTRLLHMLDDFQIGSIRRGWTFVTQTVADVALGHNEDAVNDARQWALAIADNRKPVTAAYLMDIMSSAHAAGISELFEIGSVVALEHDPTADERRILTEVRSQAAFERGDYAQMRSLLVPLLPDQTPGRSTTRQLVLAEAWLHHDAQARAALAEAKAHPTSDAWGQLGLMQVECVALIGLADTKQALPACEAMMAEADRQHVGGLDYAENQTWLALALLAAHQSPERARDLLEDALGGAWNILIAQGHAYFTPIAQLALGRTLWDLDTDRPRAVLLVEAARDGFALQGHGRDGDREAATTWLSKHATP